MIQQAKDLEAKDHEAGRGIVVRYGYEAEEKVYKKTFLESEYPDDYSERASKFIANKSGVISAAEFKRRHSLSPGVLTLAAFRGLKPNITAGLRANHVTSTATGPVVVSVSPEVSPIAWHEFSVCGE